MSRRFTEVTPQNPGELEQFYLQVMDKLKGTESTLAEEALKTITPIIGMVRDLDRKVKILSDGIKTSRATNSRQPQEIRTLRAQLSRLESRLSMIEKEIP